MSHQPERKHKNCLNCGVMVKGRYCQRCGQENIETRQSFLGFLKHFVFDIFHFDGKFFDTLGVLFSKPGRVPMEYSLGKRTKYLEPVRMYLFTSAIFFLIFFNVRSTELSQSTGLETFLPKTRRMDAAMELHARDLKDSLRPVEKKALAALLDSTLIIEFNRDTAYHPDSSVLFRGKFYRFTVTRDSSLFQSPEASNSWLERVINRKFRRIIKENKDDPERAMKEMGLKIVHRLPYMLFVSLPFFALILKLIYFRKKQVYYSDHIVFTLYHYIFSFMLLLIIMLAVNAYSWTRFSIFLWLLAACNIYWLYYLYRGLRVFYHQGRLKTIMKFILLNILGFILFVFLVAAFAFFSFIEF